MAGSFLRLVFAATLFQFFWVSAGTKFDGPFTLSFGAYVQIFPQTLEAVGHDETMLGPVYTIIALLGSYGEYILPLFIVLGLFTRLSALGMIAFIVVMSVVDITGHGVDPGVLFDKDPTGIIFDQRLFWITALIWLFSTGGGWLSLDQLIAAKMPFKRSVGEGT